jgi:hypothetical protein
VGDPNAADDVAVARAPHRALDPVDDTVPRPTRAGERRRRRRRRRRRS